MKHVVDNLEITQEVRINASAKEKYIINTLIYLL